MSLVHSAIVLRRIGATSSTRNVFASALVAFAASSAMLGTALLPLPAAAAGPVVSEAGMPDAVVPASSRPGGMLLNSDVLTVMVELTDRPASLVYADSLNTSIASAGGSFSSLSKPAQDAVIGAAVSAAKVQVSRIEAAQKALLPTLTSMAYGGKIVFRTKSVYNGISMYATRGQLAALAKLQGVKAVHIQTPKSHSAATDIDFLGARSAWTKITPNSPFGLHGENIKLADIDTGLDYIHTNFGGPGTPAAYASITDTGPVPNPYFPSFKVPGGYDFAGDAYDANQPPGTGHDPVPDTNPMDANGHGTGTASLAAGLGVAANGSTFVGVYDNATDIASLKISPGFAPKAFLYPLRVFGKTGSTNLVVQALDWAIDPNGDGNLADHMDVVNMSLGADDGYPDDPDAVAASNAGAVGAIVVSAAGNAGDSYYIVSSPSVGSGTMSVAATFNNTGGFFFDSNVTANSPPAIAGQKYNSIYGSPSPHVAVGGLAGNVVYANPHTGSADGVSPLLNAAAMPGNICLIDRGTIGFANKVALCQSAGAIATVVVQSVAGSGTPNPIVMSLVGPPTSSIPAVMIGLNEGAAIKAQLDPITGTGANVTINNDNGFVSLVSTAADTLPTYSSRGPRLGDSMLKPDISAPAEVVGVATALTGSNVSSFNGTSSATPHVSGIMALLRELHPTWSVQELMALAMNTATHDLFVGPSTGAGAQWTTSRVGAGRIDVINASTANVVAYNQTDPGLIDVSFGIVEVPVASSATLSKTIVVVNKGSAAVTYNVTYVDVSPVAGATFTVGSGSPVTVAVGGTATIPVTFAATGNLLKHVRDAAATVNLPSARQWLTEKTGYAVLTPTAGPEPTLRVALYASPKPVSSMHATATVPGAGPGQFNVGLAGSPVNTGNVFNTANQDIVSLVKPFELQYASPLISAPTPPTDTNVIKYAGVTSDFIERGASPQNTVLTFLLEGFGNASMPSLPSTDKEINISIDGGVTFNYLIYLSSAANGADPSNVYTPVIIDFNAGVAFSRFRTNGLSPATNDTNIYNNSLLTMPILATDIGLLGAGNVTQLVYDVATFDRANNQVDDTGPLHYDLANPGIDAQGGNLDPFFYLDLPATTIPVTFNGANLLANNSIGMILAHMHNGTGVHTDSVMFAAPVLQSAVSRKVHGAAGTFDLPLSAVPTNPTTEPRIGPAQTLVFTFDKPVNAATVTVTEGTATAAAPTFSGNDVIVNLSGVSNVQYVTVTLSNVSSADGSSGGTGAVRVGYLGGDVNQNRVVSLADLVLVNAQLAHLVTASNYLKDVNASGTLSLADYLIVNNLLAKALPAP